jgi:hypothetical protein
MKREDQYSRDREKLERFGFHKSAPLDSITEMDENDEDQIPTDDALSPLNIVVQDSEVEPNGLEERKDVESNAIEEYKSVGVDNIVGSDNEEPLNSEGEPILKPESFSQFTANSEILQTQSLSRLDQTQPSTSQLKNVVSTVKEIRSVLQKQSGFLGLWKQKYFVLTPDSLRYYKYEKDFKENNGSCKIFILKSSTILAYTKYSLVFKIINDEDSRSKEELCLMAESKKDLDSWISGLKKAISTLYLEQRKYRKSVKGIPPVGR